MLYLAAQIVQRNSFERRPHSRVSHAMKPMLWLNSGKLFLLCGSVYLMQNQIFIPLRQMTLAHGLSLALMQKSLN